MPLNNAHFGGFSIKLKNIEQMLGQRVGQTVEQSAEKPIDNVTIKNLGAALRVCNVDLDDKTLDLIIEIVEMIEEKGDDLSIIEIKRLESELELMRSFKEEN